MMVKERKKEKEGEVGERKVEPRAREAGICVGRRCQNNNNIIYERVLIYASIYVHQIMGNEQQGTLNVAAR